MIGVDAGSTAVKVVEVQDGRVGYKGVHRASHLGSVLKDLPEGEVYATGYFRRQVGGRGMVTEITAAAEGARRLMGKVEVVIDIGGQDTKVVVPGENRFQINDKCSAGTGAFLETVAGYLDVRVEDLGPLDEGARVAVGINNTCTVFAQTEIISHLAEGRSRGDVVAGVHRAFARRIAQMVPETEGRIAVIGGVALNSGVIRALEGELCRKVMVPDEPQYVNAVGAAVYGAAQPQ